MTMNSNLDSPPSNLKKLVIPATINCSELQLPGPNTMSVEILDTDKVSQLSQDDLVTLGLHSNGDKTNDEVWVVHVEDVQLSNSLHFEVVNSAEQESVDSVNIEESGSGVKAPSNKKLFKQAPKNPLGHFLHEEKLKLANECLKLNYEESLEKWKTLSPLKKSKYQEKFKHEKEKLGNSFRRNIKANKMKPEEAHERKLQRGREWQKKAREVNAKKIKEEKENTIKLKEMLERKIMKAKKLEAMREELKSKLCSLEIENHAIAKLTKEKRKSEIIEKEKYKAMFKHHTSCSKK